MLAHTVVVIILQYINVSHQHVTHLKLTQCYVSIRYWCKKSLIKCIWMKQCLVLRPTFPNHKRGSKLGELTPGGRDLPREAGVCDDCLPKNPVGQMRKDWEELVDRKEVVLFLCSFQSGFCGNVQVGAFFPYKALHLGLCVLCLGMGSDRAGSVASEAAGILGGPGWWLSTLRTPGIPDPYPCGDDGAQAPAQGLGTGRNKKGRESVHSNHCHHVWSLCWPRLAGQTRAPARALLQVTTCCLWGLDWRKRWDVGTCMHAVCRCIHAMCMCHMPWDTHKQLPKWESTKTFHMASSFTEGQKKKLIFWLTWSLRAKVWNLLVEEISLKWWLYTTEIFLGLYGILNIVKISWARC